MFVTLFSAVFWFLRLYSAESSTLYGDGVYLQYHVTIAIRIFMIQKDGLLLLVFASFL